MNKRIKQLATSGSLTDMVEKLSAAWRLRTQPNTTAKVSNDESTESILCDLIAIPTVTGNYEANHEGLLYIEAFLRRYGMHVTWHEKNGVESLTATSRPTKTPTVFLAAHLDVVAASPELFELKVEAERYTGRGVLDMKGALAAYLGVVKQLEGRIHEYDFGIMITTDEEIGGFDGASKLAEDGYLSKIMVLPDGGLNNWDMERFAKGIWWITITAAGEVAHGSRPWEGSNPIETIMAAGQEILALFPDASPDKSSASLTVMHAGKTINQIPARASASFDMRFATFEEQAQMHDRIADIVARYNLTLTTEVEADPMINDVENEYLVAYKACAEDVLGKPVNWVVSNAGNDGRFFAKRGVACAIAYPLGANHHGPNEWISKASLAQMQQIFANYLDKVAIKPANKA